MRIITILLTITFLPLALSAQSRKLSLNEAIGMALQNNVAIKNAKLDVLKQKALNDEITGLAYPQISAKGELIDYIDQVKTFVPGEFFGQPGTFTPVTFTPKFSSTASLSASQLLFDGSVLVALQARKVVMRLFEQKAKLTEDELKYNITLAYYSLVISQKQFAIQKEALVNTRSLANDIDIMYRNGVREKIDADRFRLIVNNAATDSLRNQNLISLNEQYLKYQVGIPLEQKIILTDTAIEKNITNTSKILMQQLDYTVRAEFNVLQSQLTLNEYDLKRYKLARLPSLAAFASAGYNYSSNEFGDIFKAAYPFNSLVGLTLNVPIFSGMQKVNKIKQAQIEVQKTRNTIEDLKLGLNLQYTQARTQLRNALLSLQAQQDNLALANSVMDLARIKYKEGVGSNQEIVDAQNTFLQTQANYFLALMDVINSRTSLEKQLGLIK